MGFFSWECKGCGHSIRSHHSTNATSAWMSKVVVVFADGDRVSGEYDGYGRVGAKLDYEGLEDGAFAMFHRTCWELSGSPEFVEPSCSASDQGYFVGEFDPREPRTLGDCIKLRSRAESADRAHERAWSELLTEATAKKGKKACERRD